MVFLCIAATAAIWTLWEKDDLGHWPLEDTAIGSRSIADASPEKIPAYNGDSVIELNGGKPCFSAEDLLTITRENYSELDRLGRCGTVVVMLDKTMMFLYRVSPYFKGSEKLARGVGLEAYSVEDNGEGICFHVFLYNVQPGIEIDYATGESRINQTM